MKWRPKNYFERTDDGRRQRGGTCACDSNHWCSHCISFGMNIEVTLPDGQKSRGTIMGNFTERMLEEIGIEFERVGTNNNS